MCNDNNEERGKFYAIGLGPGDPDLLTVKAVKILKSVDSIIVPKARIKSESVARDIVSRALGKKLPFIEMVFPMSRDKKRCGNHWDGGADVILKLLYSGKDVAFVTLGDVSLYSTFSYLETALRTKDKSIKTELIPGISSVQLAAVKFEKPLALGDETYGVYPLPSNISNLDSALVEHETIMIMKIGGRLGELKSYLQNKGLLNSSGFIRRAGFPNEYLSHSLENINEKETGYLSIVMVRRGAVKQ